jgi:hypothetical protein
MEGDERGNDPQTACRGGLIWVDWARGLFCRGKWAELLGKACKQTIGSSIGLSHLIQGESTYADYLQVCFIVLCLVGHMSRAVLR